VFLQVAVVGGYLAGVAHNTNPVPALALGGVGSLPRASWFRGPHSSRPFKL